MNKRAEYNTSDLTNTEMRSKWTGNKVKKVAGGQWEDQKTKELLRAAGATGTRLPVGHQLLVR